MSADAPERSREHTAANAGASFLRAFSRLGRLLKHSDFDRVYKEGRRHFSSHMTVFYLRRAEGGSTETAPPEKLARVGFTVGRVLGGAVERNRIKRRLREAVRLRGLVRRDAGAVEVEASASAACPSAAMAGIEAGRATWTASACNPRSHPRIL